MINPGEVPVTGCIEPGRTQSLMPREYVAVYYNSKRLHSTLDYKTPLNYEKDLNKASGIT